jgi:hypothetical protein
LQRINLGVVVDAPASETLLHCVAHSLHVCGCTSKVVTMLILCCTQSITQSS